MRVNSAVPILCQKEPETIDLIEKTGINRTTPNASKLKVSGETIRNSEHLSNMVYLTFKARALGSSPRRITTKIRHLRHGCCDRFGWSKKRTLYFSEFKKEMIVV